MKKNRDYFKTLNGFYCPLKSSMAVTEDGQWAAAIQVTDSNKYQLVKENFLTNKNVIFKYVHNIPAEAVVLNESKNIVMSGGLDRMAVVYNWSSGDVIKVLDIIIGPISFFHRIGSLLIMTETETLRFVDTANDVEIRMKPPVKSHCKFVSCMTVGQLKGPEEAEPEEVLIYGGTDSSKLNVFLIQEDLKG